jgi:hypothetical protein
VGSSDSDVVQSACVAEAELAAGVDHIVADSGLQLGGCCAGWSGFRPGLVGGCRVRRFRERCGRRVS